MQSMTVERGSRVIQKERKEWDAGDHIYMGLQNVPSTSTVHCTMRTLYSGPPVSKNALYMLQGENQIPLYLYRVWACAECNWH